MFAFELQRRLDAAGSPVRSLAAHPGYASTELQSHTETVLDRVMALGNRLVAQSADMGALPDAVRGHRARTLPAAATSAPAARLSCGGTHARSARRAPRGTPTSRARLWELSEELTGIRYP